jgi:GH15 family glucan-1,4-alpha-glucosidase
MALAVDGGLVRAGDVLEAGDRIYCALSWADDLAAPIDADQADDCLAATVAFWRTWLGRMGSVDHRYRQAVERSALAVKGLSYMPTGATVTSLTASRPPAAGEQLAGECRATSLGLSALVLEVLHRLDLDSEADACMAFVAGLAAGADGRPGAMVRIDGRPIDAWTPASAQPMVCGPVLDAVLRHARRRRRLDPRLWSLVRAQADAARTAWQAPDQGLWATPGPPRQHVASKVLWWVALDRAAELAAMRRDAGAAAAWRAAAGEVRADVEARGVDHRGVLRGCYDGGELDAAVLLAAILGFWPGDDERLRATVLAVAGELVEDGLVVSTRAGAAVGVPDGLLIVCSFWLVSALAIVGERRRAGDLMDRLLRLGSPLGLYAARLDPSTAHHRGDFPKAASHLTLIEAAERITQPAG